MTGGHQNTNNTNTHNHHRGHPGAPEIGIEPILEDSHSHVSESYFSHISSEDGDEATQDEAFQNGDDLARSESKAICWLRGVVMALMFFTGLLVSVVVFIVSRNSENSEFEAQFETYAIQALDSMTVNLEINLGNLESLAVSMTSHGIIDRDDNNDNDDGRGYWPMVTIPDFTSRVAPTLQLTNALSVGIVPLVPPTLRAEWETYSMMEGPEWIIADNRAYLVDLDGSRRHRHHRHLQEPGDFPDYSNGFSSEIYTVEKFPDSVGSSSASGLLRQVETVQDPPYYLPIWQNSQAVPGLVNYNLQTSLEFGPGANACVASQKSVVSMVDLERVGPVGEAVQNVWEPDILGDHVGDPLSVLYFPIFDTFDDPDDSITTDINSPPPKKNMVGMVQLIAYWSAYFENMSDDARGLIVVLQNECNQTFSYEINGPEITFLGRDDYHDTTYSDLFFEIAGFDALGAKRGGGIAGGLTPLNLDFCSMSVRVYPSEATKAVYRTSKPGLYTFSVVVVFIFAVGIFVSYDCIVERRQKMVLKTAVENRAIVASLFPEAIRDRLFNTDDTLKKEEEKKRVEETIQASGLLGGAGSGIGRESLLSDGLDGNASQSNLKESAPLQLKNYLNNGGDNDSMLPGQDNKPIADLFPDSTVMFGDIAGFTAWSSSREPTEVFTLLQTLYQAFDKIAKKLSVFKIETIGDCYVAVTGLPEVQPDHAVRMARFARECVYRMQELVKRLEVTLGPDTADLSLRVGMHSGPVTAGVLRGEKSRFQLFGDTVNTAARMESTGVRNRIQVSVFTAELIRKGGKSGWLSEREGSVHAKGKGELKTFWVATRASGGPNGMMDSSTHGGGDSEGVRGPLFNASLNSAPPTNNDKDQNNNIPTQIGVSTADDNMKATNRLSDNSQSSVLSGDSFGGGDDDDDDDDEEEADAPPTVPAWTTRMVAASQTTSSDEKEQRLIDWHVDLLSRLLKRIIARRNITTSEEKITEGVEWTGSGKLVAEEVADYISFIKVDQSILSIPINPDLVELGEDVVLQLKEFIQRVAKMYNPSNPFHNFEHASHVTMSTNKLFNRILTPTRKTSGEQTVDPNVYDYTSRIKYDPLVHFAVVFSAVIHDAEHQGVSNMDLIREKADFAECYGNRSVAEQHSVDVAWELLMDPMYKDLRQCIYKDKEEFLRFRQIVVQMVMATDIFDKDLKAFRERRWKQAFGGIDEPSTEEELQNLRATVMLEHTIQASDVGHAMQHWQIFRKWNERLFEEMVAAYETGHSSNDPIGGWFEGEVMFYDFYIIPLAKKLLDSQAFGVAGDEYLNYALDNRAEWAAKGVQLVREMGSKYHREKVLADLLQNSQTRMDIHKSGGTAA